MTEPRTPTTVTIPYDEWLRLLNAEQLLKDALRLGIASATGGFLGIPTRIDPTLEPGTWELRVSEPPRSL